MRKDALMTAVFDMNFPHIIVHDTWVRLRDRPFVSETVRGLGDSERTSADHEAVGDTTPGSETASAIGEKLG